MRHPGLPWRVIWCGLVLLNVVLYSDVATAQLTVNPSSISFSSVPVGLLGEFDYHTSRHQREA